MPATYPDYRTPSQRRRDLDREWKERRQREAELSAARRAEVDRQIELRELFPRIVDRDLSKTACIAYAYRLQDLDVMEATWSRLWYRSHDAYLEALSRGDKAAAALAKEEVDQLTPSCMQIGETIRIQDELRKAEKTVADMC